MPIRRDVDPRTYQLDHVLKGGNSSELWLATWNLNGLRAKWEEAMQIIQDHDITSLIETKIDQKVTDSSLMLPGYLLFRQDRNTNGGESPHSSKKSGILPSKKSYKGNMHAQDLNSQ